MANPKTVIITGAGSGIGAATAKRFSADGWNVVLNGRTRDKLEKVAAELPGERTLVVDGDVSEPGDVAQLVDKTVDRFGALDCLVNNAGVAQVGRPGELSRTNWETLMAVNVTGIYNTTTEALPHLRASKGSIVNTSSVSGLGGDWKMFGYNTAKGAVSNMTRAMALDLGADGVRVNAVAPSVTLTGMAEGIHSDPEKLAMVKNRIPMKRPAEPEEVANVIAFLAGPDAGFVNGVILPVDGGLTASNGQPNFDG
ncbi:SDR family NAD(P)-dependent oxidoreductase [Henriciella aquimarina]|uniref:SDR family NAD(P)-dependent oxidoreductase n=1 Tax=Henriciella aquimarina TaxID=545261 RepID=UPI000A05C4A8|nr:SDR family oxidoreductase [Henriciella aquimarina]